MLTTDPQYGEDRRAVIVCSHIAAGAHILRAVRDAPEVDEDSGWQFLCGGPEEEDLDKAKVWLVSEILAMEPSLAPYINLSPRLVLTRENIEGAWNVIKE